MTAGTRSINSCTWTGRSAGWNITWTWAVRPHEPARRTDGRVRGGVYVEVTDLFTMRVRAGLDGRRTRPPDGEREPGYRRRLRHRTDHQADPTLHPNPGTKQPPGQACQCDRHSPETARTAQVEPHWPALQRIWRRPETARLRTGGIGLPSDLRQVKRGAQRMTS